MPTGVICARRLGSVPKDPLLLLVKIKQTPYVLDLEKSTADTIRQVQSEFPKRYFWACTVRAYQHCAPNSSHIHVTAEFPPLRTKQFTFHETARILLPALETPLFPVLHLTAKHGPV